MKKNQDIATLLVRLALASGFLSAASGRISFINGNPDCWKNFLDYAGKVNSFAPASFVPTLAFTSTTLEIFFGISLLLGYKTRWAATGASVLTLLFALAMVYSFGIKEPFDYSVFAFSSAAFLLATMPQNRWSIDELLIKNK